MSSADWPSTFVAAQYASWSQFDPGKTMTENFIGSVDLDAVAFDHRVGEQLIGDLARERPRMRGVGGREIELEVLPLPDVLDARITHGEQCVGYRPSLRVEHRRLQR